MIIIVVVIVTRKLSLWILTWGRVEDWNKQEREGHSKWREQYRGLEIHAHRAGIRGRPS